MTNLHSSYPSYIHGNALEVEHICCKFNSILLDKKNYHHFI